MRLPGLASFLIRRLAPREHVPELLGDLIEVHRDRVARRSRWVAAILTTCEATEMVFLLRIARARRGQGPPVSWLDVKLGIRMLAKYPGMTAVSSFAIAVTVAVALGAFGVVQDFLLRPSLPLPDGDRVVSLGMRWTDTNRTERRILHEFQAWEEGLESVRDLGLWRIARLNLVADDGRAEMIPFAAMSAAGFVVANVPPLLGRPLLESDEISGAEPVVVIGFDEWERRFEGRPDIVGHRLRIGYDQHTIVGVMPQGFAFPYSDSFWIPLRDDPNDSVPFEGRRYFAFGRLARGMTLPQAQAEMTTLTEARAQLLPETHTRLRGQVMTYTDTHTGNDDVAEQDMVFIRVALLLLSLVVLIPFANVAILVYARTATRSGEIVLRIALGASRTRVVMQLFAEALVLATLSAAVGVGLTWFAWSRVETFLDVYFGAGMPFWARQGRNGWAVAYAVGITILAATMAGVVPGLKATGPKIQQRLKQSAGRNGMRLGFVWTSLIVVQVAVTVALLPIVGWVGWDAIGQGTARATFAVDGLLGVAIAEPAPDPAREATDAEESIREIVRRLEADSRVAGVVLSDRLPDELFSVSLYDFDRIEIEGVDPPEGASNHSVGSTLVDPGFFEFLGVPVEAGREFAAIDLRAEVRPVVVNRAFVDRWLSGTSTVGRHIREFRPDDEESVPWREIVGVVAELAENPLEPGAGEARIFTPLDRETTRSAYLTVRARTDPRLLVPDIERMVTNVDPGLRIQHAALIADERNPIRAAMRLAGIGIWVVLSSVLLLCTAGVFALMSFNVTQRRREIGVRTALGASPHRVLIDVMARSARQLLVGVAVGALVVAVVPPFSLDGLPIDRDPRLVALLAMLMVTVGLTAAALPARRGLRIQPTEALREE